MPHLFPVTATPADVDGRGQVGTAAYLQWVQEAVLDHWRTVAPPEAIAAHLWVALSHEITFHRAGMLGDDLCAVLRFERVQGARAFYHAAITRGDVTLAEVRSVWCCIDAQYLRPARLARDIVNRFFAEQ